MIEIYPEALRLQEGGWSPVDSNRKVPRERGRQASPGNVAVRGSRAQYGREYLSDQKHAQSQMQRQATEDPRVVRGGGNDALFHFPERLPPRAPERCGRQCRNGMAVRAASCRREWLRRRGADGLVSTGALSLRTALTTVCAEFRIRAASRLIRPHARQQRRMRERGEQHEQDGEDEVHGDGRNGHGILLPPSRKAS
jgi:hypothetical protein